MELESKIGMELSSQTGASLGLSKPDQQIRIITAHVPSPDSDGIIVGLVSGFRVFLKAPSVDANVQPGLGALGRPKPLCKG